MVRILACSDIHNNVAAARKLRSLETGKFDAVVVAGDIGSTAAHEVFAELQSLACPVLFVFGNWDHGLHYAEDFGSFCHHVHLAPVRIADISIIGQSFDGVDPAWESIRSKIDDGNADALKDARQRYAEQQTAELASLVRKEGAERTIVVSHYRLTKVRSYLPDVPLFLFGHNHGFADSTYHGQRFVNVSALDTKVTVKPVRASHISRSDYRNANDGVYVVIEHGGAGGFDVQSRRFNPDLTGWKRLEKEVYWNAPDLES